MLTIRLSDSQKATLRERIKEVMLQWGSSMSDFVDESTIEEWVDDLVKAVEAGEDHVDYSTL